MIRVLVYLVIVALLAFGAVWFAERPGDVAITWQGRRIDHGARRCGRGGRGGERNGVVDPARDPARAR
jgi:hypothetical protein